MTAVPVFSSIVGQPAAVRTLTQALASGRIHHAYRFEGPSGVGKRHTAVAFAQSLLCERDARGCGQCSSCKRATTLTAEAPHVPQHPDFIWVQRGLYSGTLLTAKEATGISVEQVRKVVLSRTGYGSHEGRALVVFIEDADELTVSAANALLKTLEEPGPGVHFILHTSRPHRLLDTLRSRTLAVRFGPLPDDALERLAPSCGFNPVGHPVSRRQHRTSHCPVQHGAGECARALAYDADASPGRAEHGAQARARRPVAQRPPRSGGSCCRCTARIWLDVRVNCP